jgi:aspartate/methionine/tyrosine aminotransferase
MLLYDVFYPLNTFDSSRPLPKKPPKYTIAICTNGERKQWMYAGSRFGWLEVCSSVEIPNTHERLEILKNMVKRLEFALDG